ncbi:MAG: ATP-dependent Clp protease proteolytic subunit, partial [Chloroflexota bacterium]|nr:ATP-dependent Clp protease proteolytic subunit [Chloroflexota bacterium]
MSFLLIHTTVVAQEERGTGAVVVVPITGTIDLGLAPFLTRVLAEAEADGVAAVLLEIDTPGGRLDAVLQMRDAVLGSPVRTIAFVDRTAFSAGALIAIAAGEIYMPPGAAMGAATPVDGGTGETASEKTVSAVRTTFKATAEARGRDPLVAEAMVDPDVVIEGLVERGELLTLTTGEAVRWGYADGVVDDRAELLVDAGLAAAPVVEVGPSLAERVVRFVTDPVVASLLLILALLLIVGDFFVEGFGVAGMGGVLLFGIFFWGHLLTGLAGWEDVALVGLGIVLIAVEIFVVPGFGVPGVLGLAAIGGGLFLAMLGREIQTPDGIMRAGLTVAASLVAVVIGIGLMLALLPRTRKLSGLILQPAGEVTAPRREPAAWGWLR